MKHTGFILVVAVLLCFAGLLLSIDIASASDGIIGYISTTGTNSASSPKIRLWNNSGNGSWGSEVELASAGSPLRFVIVKQSPIDSKIVLASLSNDGFIDTYVCLWNCSDSNNWNAANNVAQVWNVASTERRFDVDFQTQNGNAVLAYAPLNTTTSCDVAYISLPQSSTSFSGINAACLDDASKATDINYTWIRLDRNPVTSSNEMLLVGFDGTDSAINGWVWNGTGFGNFANLSFTAASTGGGEALAAKYAADGTKGMIAGGESTKGDVAYRYWNGTGWSAIASITMTVTNLDVKYMTMKADPATDDLQMVTVDSGSDLSTAYWNGAAWATTVSLDNGIDTNTARPADFAWMPTGSTGRLVWDTDGAGLAMSNRTCTPQCSATETTIVNYTGTGNWLSLYTNPDNTDMDKILGVRMNSVLNLGSLFYNGSFLNYGDSILTSNANSTAYESYVFAFRQDKRVPAITYTTPTPNTGIKQSSNQTYINVSINEYLSTAVIEWNGTNQTMNGSNDTWYVNKTSLIEGFYSYKVYATDFNGNLNVSLTRNITINYPPAINLMAPPNNTVNSTSANITFFYNVTDTLDNVSFCALSIDNIFVKNTSTPPVNESIALNFTYNMSGGVHNWSIFCNDTNNFNTTTDTRVITIAFNPTILSVTIDDFLTPANEIILNAGSTRNVYCTVVVSDPLGPSNIKNASATFYYTLNKSADSDDGNVHYTNASCDVNATGTNNKTFSCAFPVSFYANNGTWQCNATTFNNNSFSANSNTTSVIDPLFAVNVTNGLDFGNVEASNYSLETTVNFTNIGNMPINITLQGYADTPGDNLGMNCTGNTNISINSIRFFPLSTPYPQKIALNGSVQPFNITLNKTIVSTPVFNISYWQLNLTPGPMNRTCVGYVIFSAESP
jgi:hypothetical protein